MALNARKTNVEIQNLRPFMSHNPVRFRSIFHFLLCKLMQIVNFDGLSFLTALVLLNQSDYLNHSNKDSDKLIAACLMRV